MSADLVRYPDLHDADGPEADNHERHRLWAALVYLLKDRFDFDPADVLARVGPETDGVAAFELRLPVDKVGDSAFERVSESTRGLLISLFGHLLATGAPSPTPGGSGPIRITDPIAPDGPSLALSASLLDAFKSAGESIGSHRELYVAVHHLLVGAYQTEEAVEAEEEGAEAPPPRVVSTVSAFQVADVAAQLARQGAKADTPDLQARVQALIAG